MDAQLTRRRPRSPRGEGPRLREEILEAAGRVLDRTGRDDEVTLRAVAREVGITAPSIYPHFPDRDALIMTLIGEAFGALTRQLELARDAASDPVERLLAGSWAYLDFASHDQRHRYNLMFTRPSINVPDPDHVSDAFTILVTAVAECVDAGVSTSADPFADATAVWAGLHGLATLHAHRPDFPWPERDPLVRHVILSLAHVTETAGRDSPR